jgi:hypothetical protein
MKLSRREGTTMANGADFQINLLRMIAAELWFSNRLTVAREFLGKSYLSLSVAEKFSVDSLVQGTLGSDYQAITENFLRGQKAQQPLGFQVPIPPATAPSAPPAKSGA